MTDSGTITAIIEELEAMLRRLLFAYDEVKGHADWVDVSAISIQARTPDPSAIVTIIVNGGGFPVQVTEGSTLALTVAPGTTGRITGRGAGNISWRSIGGASKASIATYRRF